MLTEAESKIKNQKSKIKKQKHINWVDFKIKSHLINKVRTSHLSPHLCTQYPHLCAQCPHFIQVKTH